MRVYRVLKLYGENDKVRHEVYPYQLNFATLRFFSFKDKIWYLCTCYFNKEKAERVAKRMMLNY